MPGRRIFANSIGPICSAISERVILHKSLRLITTANSAYVVAQPQKFRLSSFTTMAFLDKFRAGAQKAAIQATAFAKDSSSKVASGSRDFVQGFSLPGEADKAAKILDSFLGMMDQIVSGYISHSADIVL
jgi:hypothetical protein